MRTSPHIHGPDGQFIAWIVSALGMNDVAKPNARLIAAAPLLLETLRDLVEAITGNSYDDAQEYACKGGFDSEFIAASILLSQIDNDLL